MIGMIMDSWQVQKVGYIVPSMIGNFDFDLDTLIPPISVRDMSHKLPYTVRLPPLMSIVPLAMGN